MDAPVQRRMVAEGKQDAVVRVGLPSSALHDLYHQALMLSWSGFLLFGSLLYLAVNVVFALLYMLDPGGVTEMHAGSFADAFFFSVQTFATIGYGRMAPLTLYTNLVVTAETLSGLVILALFTGLGFARFSRPTSRVMFSRNAVVGPRDGVPTLSLRLGNARRSQILEASVMVSLVRNEVTAEGVFFRRFYDLKLARARTPIFGLTFTVMHPIDSDSPLSGFTEDSILEQGAELVITVTGLDETLSQIVHARKSYLPDEILVGHRFVDMFARGAAGKLVIDYRRFHDTAKL